ncbi:MAG: hypothetical protein II007_13440 [Gammaproteobacteria bacterium]|nr:hypothetical protein [Gammaproteobacteria bacterium]
MIVRILAAALAVITIAAALLWWRLDVVDGQRLLLAQRVNEFHGANQRLAGDISNLNSHIVKLELALKAKADRDNAARSNANDQRKQLQAAQATDPAVRSWSCQPVPAAVVRLLGAKPADVSASGCPSEASAATPAAAVRSAGADDSGQR